MENNIHHDLHISSVSLYNAERTTIVYDRDVAHHNLISSLKQPYLTGYWREVVNGYLKFLATKTQIDIDYIYNISNDRLSTIKDTRNGPYFNLTTKIKTHEELLEYLKRVRERGDFNYSWDDEKKCLYFDDNLCYYDGAIYLPSAIVLEYKEWSKNVYYPKVAYNQNENRISIYLGYLMKKDRTINIK